MLAVHRVLKYTDLDCPTLASSLQVFSKSVAAMTVTVTGAPDEFEKIAHKVSQLITSASPLCVFLDPLA